MQELYVGKMFHFQKQHQNKIKMRPIIWLTRIIKVLGFFNIIMLHLVGHKLVNKRSLIPKYYMLYKKYMHKILPPLQISIANFKELSLTLLIISYFCFYQYTQLFLP